MASSSPESQGIGNMPPKGDPVCDNALKKLETPQQCEPHSQLFAVPTAQMDSVNRYTARLAPAINDIELQLHSVIPAKLTETDPGGLVCLVGDVVAVLGVQGSGSSWSSGSPRALFL